MALQLVLSLKGVKYRVRGSLRNNRGLQHRISFWPINGHASAARQRPLCANCGLMRRKIKYPCSGQDRFGRGANGNLRRKVAIRIRRSLAIASMRSMMTVTFWVRRI
jgi:hypothetical protein